MQVDDKGWNVSTYYYKDRKILVRSKKGKGMRAHVFHETPSEKVEFTLRYHWVTQKYLFDKIKRKVDGINRDM